MSAEHVNRRPITILFVAGAGRSGTTILNTILGQVPGCLAVGEVRYIWERGFTANHRCGRGLPFDRCPLWTDVVARAFPDGDLPDLTAVSQDLLDRLRIMRVPAMLARSFLGRPTVPYHRNDKAIHNLYAALADRDGVDVIVDSSKLPPYGRLVERLPGVNFFVLNVVRDPRANAWSWRRTKVTADTAEGGVTERLSLWRSSLVWVTWNSLMGLWWPASARHVTVRYEDFVNAPRETVREIVAAVGLDSEALPFVDACTTTIAPTHTLAGNPNRHQSGTVTIAADDEWRTTMPAAQKLAVTVLTAPLLHRFRYGLRG